MKDRFIISTTERIENGIIRQYIDVICSNIVVGTNIFSDFAASFSDFFGGKSESYRRKLEYIYNEASKDLKNKAIRIIESVETKLKSKTTNIAINEIHIKIISRHKNCLLLLNTHFKYLLFSLYKFCCSICNVLLDLFATA